MIFWGNPVPPTPYPNPTYPAPDYGNAGDVYIRSTTAQQFRWNGSAWNELVPNETRADTARDDISGYPGAGQLNDRVSKIGNRPWDLGWRNAADGVVRAVTETTATDQWTVNHTLTSQFVDVIVLSPGGTGSPPAGPSGQTIIFPEITYNNASGCLLKFVGNVAGTALVRR